MAQAASWRGQPPGRAHKAPGAHRSHLQVSLLPPPSSLSKNTSSALLLAFLLFLEAIFDLSLQPTVRAEIFSKYSLVCNSFTPPIRFLIGGFICEYLVALGAVHMSLHACVEIYFPSFGASLCLRKVSRVVWLNLLFLNPCFCFKKFRNEFARKSKGVAWEEKARALRSSYESCNFTLSC